jgi:hypothetical protein
MGGEKLRGKLKGNQAKHLQALNKNYIYIYIICDYIFIEKTFVTINYLIALDMLHKTLVANVDEVNGQQIFHCLYIIICHLYITIKIKIYIMTHGK